MKPGRKRLLAAYVLLIATCLSAGFIVLTFFQSIAFTTFRGGDSVRPLVSGLGGVRGGMVWHLDLDANNWYRPFSIDVRMDSLSHPEPVRWFTNDATALQVNSDGSPTFQDRDATLHFGVLRAFVDRNPTASFYLEAALWPLPTAALALAVPLLISARRARFRARLNLCANCVYDLRATPPDTPCPECGTRRV